MNRSNISRYSLLLLYKFYFQYGSSIPRFFLSSGINVLSISSGELQRIPLFVHNSHVTLLPNWFLKQTGRNGLSRKSTETLQSSPSRKPRVWRGRWPGSWRCHPEAPPPAQPSPVQSSPQPVISSTLTTIMILGEIIRPKDHQRGTRTRPLVVHLNNVTFFCVVKHKSKPGLSTKHRNSELARVCTSGV